MASLSHSSPCNFFKSPSHPKSRKYLRVRSCKSFGEGDEGKSANNVDANLVVLRERIEELRRKERSMLVKKAPRVEIDWRYNSRFDEEKHKKHNVLLGSMQVITLLVGSSVGVVFLFASLSIFLLYFLLSFLVHLFI